jgi:hypothetical protein
MFLQHVQRPAGTDAMQFVTTGGFAAESTVPLVRLSTGTTLCILKQTLKPTPIEKQLFHADREMKMIQIRQKPVYL